MGSSLVIFTKADSNQDETAVLLKTCEWSAELPAEGFPLPGCCGNEALLRHAKARRALPRDYVAWAACFTCEETKSLSLMWGMLSSDLVLVAFYLVVQTWKSHLCFPSCLPACFLPSFFTFLQLEPSSAHWASHWANLQTFFLLLLY